MKKYCNRWIMAAWIAVLHTALAACSATSDGGLGSSSAADENGAEPNAPTINRDNVTLVTDLSDWDGVLDDDSPLKSALAKAPANCRPLKTDELTDTVARQFAGGFFAQSVPSGLAAQAIDFGAEVVGVPRRAVLVNAECDIVNPNSGKQRRFMGWWNHVKIGEASRVFAAFTTAPYTTYDPETFVDASQVDVATIDGDGNVQVTEFPLSALYGSELAQQLKEGFGPFWSPVEAAWSNIVDGRAFPVDGFAFDNIQNEELGKHVCGLPYASLWPNAALGGVVIGGALAGVLAQAVVATRGDLTLNDWKAAVLGESDGCECPVNRDKVRGAVFGAISAASAFYAGSNIANFNKWLRDDAPRSCTEFMTYAALTAGTTAVATGFGVAAWADLGGPDLIGKSACVLGGSANDPLFTPEE
jgi:hypothetical protein